MSKVRNENFIVIQGFMVNDLKLKGNELLVYAIIYGFSQEKDQVFNGSLQYLADWTNSTKQGIIKNLKSLVEKNYVKKTEKIINGVKFCEYHTTELTTLLNKVEDDSKQSLTPTIKQSLTNSISTENTENKKVDKITIKQLDKEFEIVWGNYPRKQGKTNAFKSYCKARKAGVSSEDILAGLYAYINYIRKQKVDPQFIKQGSTWFSQECWNDDYSIKKTGRTEAVPDWMEKKEPAKPKEDLTERVEALKKKLRD